MNYNTDLQAKNTELQSILATVNALPDAESGVELPTLTNPGVASDLRSGKQLIDKDGKVVSGSMPEVEVATPGLSMNADGSVVAYVDQAPGYTPGGYKTYKRTQDVQAAQTIIPGTEDQEIPAYRYLTGKQTIKGDENLVPENIVSGVTIFDVAGTAEVGCGGAVAEPPSKDVDFYDYDGTRLYSYTLDEAQALTELPPLPSHDGIICQGWNWTLDEIKAQNTVIDVGALYVTEDGKTRLYIKLEHVASLTVPLNLYLYSSGSVVVDWGDGTAQETLSISGAGGVNTTHTYESTGDYVISLEVKSGQMMVGRGSSGRLFGDQGKHLVILQSFESGTSFLGFQSKSLQGQAQIKTITISNSVNTISVDALHDCFSLRCLVLPRSDVLGSYSLYNCGSLRTLCTSPKQISTGGHSCFYDCRSLRRIVLAGYSGAEVHNSSAYGCFSLRAFVIGKGITSLLSASIRNCKSLTSIVIPPSVKSIGSNAFNGCTSLLKIRFEPTTPPTVENVNAFTNVPTDCVVEVPANSLAEYQAATNYSGIAAQMVGV